VSGGARPATFHTDKHPAVRAGPSGWPFGRRVDNAICRQRSDERSTTSHPTWLSSPSNVPKTSFVALVDRNVFWRSCPAALPRCDPAHIRRALWHRGLHDGSAHEGAWAQARARRNTRQRHHVGLRESLTLVLVGAGIGRRAAMAAMSLLKNRLYDVAPTDPIAIVSAAGLMMTVAVIAGYLPASRVILQAVASSDPDASRDR
jgi:hypothetical protein